MKPKKEPGDRRREGAVKRAFSLPKDLDERLHGLASQKGVSFSGLLREAVEFYMGAREFKALHDAYARYYSKAENVRADRELAQELWEFSKARWP